MTIDDDILFWSLILLGALISCLTGNPLVGILVSLLVLGEKT